MSKIYLMSTTMMPNMTGAYFAKSISQQEASNILDEYASAHEFDDEQSNAKLKLWVSAVGHPATAEIMSILLGKNIPANRLTVKLKGGDKLLCLKLKMRLDEGLILTTKEEVEKIGYDFALIEYAATRLEDL